jgi:hypothetical protein
MGGQLTARQSHSRGTCPHYPTDDRQNGPHSLSGCSDNNYHVPCLYEQRTLALQLSLITLTQLADARSNNEVLKSAECLLSSSLWESINLLKPSGNFTYRQV